MKHPALVCVGQYVLALVSYFYVFPQGTSFVDPQVYLEVFRSPDVTRDGSGWTDEKDPSLLYHKGSGE